MRIIFTYIQFFICTLIVQSMTNGPRLLNVCIDRNTNTVTIEWTKIINNCSSFTSVEIFGNENGGVYNSIATVSDITQTTYSYVLPNTTMNRKYFLSTGLKCDGTTAISDTLLIDIMPPTTITLDSGSFDPISKQLHLGWTKNPAKDTKGYNVYRYNGNAYVLIGTTSNTSFVVEDQQYYSSNFTIAAFDSCLLTSAIGEPTHKAMNLKGVHNQCLRQNNLSWDLYKGWNSIDSQHIYVSVRNNFYELLASLGPTATNYTQNIDLGYNYCYYIRAFSENKSASSNLYCTTTQDLDTPKTLEILNVSVVDNEYIEVVFKHSPPSLSKQINLIRSLESPKTLKTYATSDIIGKEIFTYQDFDVSVNNEVYTYSVTTQNICDENNKRSNDASNILLQKENKSLKFNEYTGYLQGVDKYEIGYSKINSSTWSTESYLDPFSISTEIVPDNESGCYQVSALGASAEYISHSNTICMADSFWVLTPTIINPKTLNNQFLIVSNFIDHNKSTYTVYDRWGGIVTQNRTDKPWYPSATTNQSGVFIFVVEATSIDGEKKIIKGSLTVLR